MGPLGDTHADILEKILHKQGQKNPLRVARDAINNCCYGMLVGCEKMVPSEVSEDMRMERTRPMKAEVKAIIFLMFLVGVFGIVFLYAMYDTARTAIVWDGPAMCEVLDYQVWDSTRLPGVGLD